MPGPYDLETEKTLNWKFNPKIGDWDFTRKNQPPLKSKVETRANHEGVQIRKVGTEKWIPVSELFTPPKK